MANRHRRTLENPKTAKQRATFQEILLQREGVKDTDIRELIQDTGLIERDEVNIWIQQLDKGDEDYLFALLIALLPNLQNLRINLDREKLEQVKEMLRRIRRQTSSSRALRKIKVVHILEKDGSGSCDLELFPLAAALPGVERMHGRNLVGMYRECYRDGWMSYPGASPSITHISLETCGMSVEGLGTLMKSLKKIQSFKYVAHRGGWGLHAIAELLKEARESLHTLEISTGSGSSRYVGTLRPFTALKNIVLDTDMIMKNGKVQRAVDILPASIERVTLCGNNLTEPQEQAFLADLYRPAFTYPCLKSIGVEDSYGRRCIGSDRLKFQKEFRRQSSSSWMLRYR